MMRIGHEKRRYDGFITRKVFSVDYCLVILILLQPSMQVQGIAFLQISFSLLTVILPCSCARKPYIRCNVKKVHISALIRDVVEGVSAPPYYKLRVLLKSAVLRQP